MNEILFSILIPAYKRVFLEEAIESIVNQSYNNWELIIVDDCSPEDLFSVVNRFKDSRVFYYRNEINFGAVDVVDNWNKSLSFAHGDFIICMGDDDKLCRNCLESYCELITKYPKLNVYHGQTFIIDEKSNIVDIQTARPEYESPMSIVFHRWKGRKQYIGDFLFRKSSLLTNGGFFKLPLAWGSDDITVVINSLGYGIANTQTPVFQYRVSSYTISKSRNASMKLKAVSDQVVWFKMLFQNYKPLNDLDNIYMLNCIKMQDVHFVKDRIWVVSSDITSNPIKIVYWLFNYKKSGLSFLLIVYSILSGIRDYISIRYSKLKSNS